MLVDADPRSSLPKKDARLLAAIACEGLRCARAQVRGPQGRAWTGGELAQAGCAQTPQGRSCDAMRWQRSRQQMTGCEASFTNSTFSTASAAVQQTEASWVLPLAYDQWRAIDKAAALPDNAEVDWKLGVARIPQAWVLTLSSCNIWIPELNDTPSELMVPDIEESTSVASVLARIANMVTERSAHKRTVSLSMYVQSQTPPLDVPETSPRLQQNGSANSSSTSTAADAQEMCAPTSPAETANVDSSGDLTLVSPHETAKSADLFNRQSRLLVTSVPQDDDDSRGYAQRRKENNEPIHNPRPRAPEHIGMVNNLISQRERLHHATNLTSMKATKKRNLSLHLEEIG